MAKIKVPERHLEGFKAFLMLDLSTVLSLVSEIQKLDSFKSESEVIKLLSEKTSIDHKTIVKIFQSLESLSMAYESFAMPIDEFIIGISEDLEVNGNLEIDESFRIQIKKLLENESIFSLNNKARGLFSNREKLLTDTKIITDVRPVFSETGTLKLYNSLVVQNLKIEYIENSERKELFLALDKNDLKKLQKNIKRAFENASLIKKEMPTKFFEDIE